VNVLELYCHHLSVSAQACRAVTFIFTSKTAAWVQSCNDASELPFVVASMITLQAVSDIIFVDPVVLLM
jgi:hypothetical protein